MNKCFKTWQSWAIAAILFSLFLAMTNFAGLLPDMNAMAAADRENAAREIDWKPADVNVVYDQITVNVNVNLPEGGDVTGGGTYPLGASVTVTAKPADGYVFEMWTESDGRTRVEGAGPEYSFTPTGDLTLVAQFRKVLIEDIPDQVYTGNPIEPSGFNVFLEGVDVRLIEGTDYWLTYEENIYAGTGVVRVTFSRDYTGTATKEFCINPASISEAKVEIPDQVYAGTALEPKPVVTWNSMRVDSGDYSLVYENNVDAGTATVTVKGRGNFVTTSSAEGTFRIKPCPVTFTGETASRVYTGSEIALTGVTVTRGTKSGLPGGQTHNVVFSAKGTEVGEYPGTITARDAVVIKAGNADVTKNYDITVVNGKLTITAQPDWPPCPEYWNEKGIRYHIQKGKATAIGYADAEVNGAMITGEESREQMAAANQAAGMKEIAIPARLNIYNHYKIPVTAVSKNAFRASPDLQKVTLGKNVKKLGKYCFDSCPKLKTVNLGKGVATIGERAFWNCAGLTAVSGGDAVTKIEEHAFSQDKTLKTIPAFPKLKTIGDEAFHFCAALTEVTLGKKVASLGKRAFGGCEALESVTVKTTKLKDAKVGVQCFQNISAKAVFKCPKGKADAYAELFVKKGAPGTCTFK